MKQLSRNNTKLAHGLISQGYRNTKSSKEHCVELKKGNRTIKLFTKTV